MRDRREIYPLNRDDAESKRLDFQHGLIGEITGGSISRNIPIDNLMAIADIATGTGVWLQDVQKYLDQVSPTSPRHYYGFDISESQFPRDSSNIQFCTHDVLRVFPEEYLNFFDLVNLRLVVGAIPEPGFWQMINHLFSIVKPQGYLQWIELDAASYLEGNAGDYPQFKKMLEPLYSFAAQNDLTPQPSEVMRNVCEDAGFIVIEQTCYDISNREDLKSKICNWHFATFSSMMPQILTRVSFDAETFQSRDSVSWLNEFDCLLQQGLEPGGKFTVVTCQKPSEDQTKPC